MFHPGKVLSVIRSDDKTVLGVDKSVQAMVSMWDENLLCVEVETAIADKVKEGDVVLIDYSPKYSTIPVPRQVAVKILRGETGKRVWGEYSERHAKRKTESDSERPEGAFNVR